MVLKALLSQSKAHYIPKANLQINPKTLRNRTLLCCWRPKVDPDEKLWAHLRSLDIATIIRLYRELIPIAKQQGIRIIDITRYRDHEAKELLNRHPSGLNLAAHSLRSFWTPQSTSAPTPWWPASTPHSSISPVGVGNEP